MLASLLYFSSTSEMDLKISSLSGIPVLSLTIAMIMAAVFSSQPLSFNVPEENSSPESSATAGAAAGAAVEAAAGAASGFLEKEPTTAPKMRMMTKIRNNTANTIAQVKRATPSASPILYCLNPSSTESRNNAGFMEINPPSSRSCNSRCCSPALHGNRNTSRLPEGKRCRKEHPRQNGHVFRVLPWSFRKQAQGYRQICP